MTQWKHNGKLSDNFAEDRMKKIAQCLLVFAASALIVFVLVLSSVPPVSRDALTHHLVVPKLYLEHGGIYEIPSIKFSYYPMNLDLLYLVPLFFGNDIIPKYIHFSFALLTALLIHRYLKKRLGNLYGYLGVIFFLSIPIILKLSITVYVDLGLIFFSFASLIYLLKWCSHGFRLQFLFLSSLYCGLALGTKYNALILFVLLALLIPVAYSRSVPAESVSSFAAMKYSAFFILIALLFFSPWMIRNYTWKKNPIYPLYHQFFSAEKVDREEEMEEGFKERSSEKRFGSFAIRHIVYQESWWQTALIPIRIFFQGEDNNPKFFDGKLNPFLLILPFYAFWGYRGDRRTAVLFEMKIMLAFSALFLLFAFFAQDIRIRYISPIIPPLVVLSIFGLYNLIEKARRKGPFFRRAVYYILSGIVIFWMLGINAGYMFDQFRHVEPLAYISGKIDRETYIESYRPEYAVMKYANRHLPSDAEILSLFLGSRYYYSDRKIIFRLSMFADAVKTSETPEAMVSELKQNGITHIMIGYELFNIWANNSFKKQQKIRIDRFFNHQVVYVFSKNGYGLYQLK
ncbi:MAG: hypothetical protein ABIK15_01190 [Pseudomonadota bacterium]